MESKGARGRALGGGGGRLFKKESLALGQTRAAHPGVKFGVKPLGDRGRNVVLVIGQLGIGAGDEKKARHENVALGDRQKKRGAAKRIASVDIKARVLKKKREEGRILLALGGRKLGAVKGG